MKAASDKEQHTGLTQFFREIKKNWYLFGLSAGVFLFLAWLYVKYTPKQYQITSTLLLQEQQTSRGNSSSGDFGDLGSSSLLGIKDNVENEAAILKSRHLAMQVVRNLQLHMKVFSGTGLRAREIYQEAPFEARISGYSRGDSVKKCIYEVYAVNDSTYRLVCEEEGIDREVRFGKPVPLTQYDFVLDKKPEEVMGGGTYSVEVISEDAAASQLLSSYNVEFPDKNMTAVNMTLHYGHPEKGELILQALMNQYLLNHMHDKIRRADSTLVFIDDRLAGVADQLNEVEQEMEKYKSTNSITDIANQSRVLVDNATQYNNRLQEQETRLSVINELEQYLKNPDNPRVIPGSLTIQDASFNSSLSRYNELLLELERKSLSYTDSNPVIQNLNQQIQSVRSTLLSNIEAYKKEMELNTRELGIQNNTLIGQIQEVPEKERIYQDYARQRDLKQQLYVYLLHKREEAAIARNANLPVSRIVDDAKSSRSPVKPRKPVIYFMAFVLGMLLPLTYVNSKDLLYSKIKSESDIEKYAEVAIIGKIGHNRDAGKLVIDRSSRSLISEGFRSLRTNLQYALDFNQTNVIMVTSSMVGEGKTFLIWNLGSALALAGKKVVFMELDLRKPKLSKLMGIDNEFRGYSDYVTGNADINSIVKPCLFNENCYIVTSGPVMDNASELLLSPKLEHLIRELKTQFDYVVIDTPPVGLVSDALIIERFADMTIYVCRHNYTNKSQIEIANDLSRNAKIKNLHLVINDVNMKSDYGYAYGYEVEERGRIWGKRKSY